MEGLDDGQIQNLIEKIGGKYKEIFEIKRQRPFSYTPIKEKVFKVLKDKNMISSYKVKDDKSEIKVVALYK